MSRLRRVLARLAALLRSGSRQDRDLDDEIAAHLAEAAEDYMAQGLSPEEARLAAMRRFGGVTQTKEQYRRARAFPWLDEIRQDVRYAVRTLAATPAFTAVVVLTLALGIGANSAIFSIVNGLLLRSLPVQEPARLVHVTDSVRRDSGETRVRAWSHPVWQEIHRRTPFFEGTTAWASERFDLASGGEAQIVHGLWADGGFFDLLGVTAVLGRTFTVDDDRPGGGADGPVAVISHRYWQRQYGGDLDVIGRTIKLDGVSFTIVGVTPAAFFGLEVGRAFDVAVPLQTERLVRGSDSALDSASTNLLGIVARLRPGQTLDDASGAMRRAQPAIRAATLQAWGDEGADRHLASPFTVVPAATGFSYLRESYARPVLILNAIVAVVLLIGCLNVATLLLARAARRRHELTVRLALGASRFRLARQLFVESLMLSLAGGGLAVVVAIYGSRALVQQLSTPAYPVFLNLTIDPVVLGFTMAVALVTAMLFGTAPAFTATRVSPIDAMKAHARASARGARGGLADALVVVQVALAVVLTVGAGLFVRSFAGLATRPMGFDPAPVLIATIDGLRADADPGRRRALFERAREAARAVPGVGTAAVSFLTPLGGGGFTPPVEVPDAAPSDSPVFGNLVSPGWFETFGTRVVAGRDIAETDRSGAPRVIVVNEAFVRRFFGGASPLGRTVTVFPRTPRALSAQVVGVAEDAVYGSPRDSALPTWYLPIAQFDIPEFPFESARLSVRAAAGAPDGLRAGVAAALVAVNPRLSLTFRSLADQVRGSLTRDRLMAQLAGSLGVLALVLAALGVYGVSGRALAGRRGEMAIRVALGAEPTRVVARVLGRVCLLVTAGIAGGLVLSAWAATFATGLVYGFAPREPAILAGAAIALGFTGLAAAWLPARQASRMDPMRVLRDE